MNIKTLTGKSIQAALAEARQRLGEDVVLMESTAATGNAPARIKVMVDEPVADAAPPRTNGYGYSAASSKQAPSKEDAALQQLEKFSDVVGQAMREKGLTDASSNGHTAQTATAPSAGRDRLFPASADDTSASPSDREELLEAQLDMLNERLDAIERRFGAAVIGSTQRWMSHPLYATLLDSGLQPRTVTTLFDQLAGRGYDPDDDSDELRWALAQELRTLLDVTVPKQTPGSLMLVGPAGAGKTSLLLKMATHEGFYARRRPAVIIVEPDTEEPTAYQSPVDLYRRFGLPVQSVHNEEEMQQALRRTEHFDQLLIDTPPLPVQKTPARQMMNRLRQLTEAFMPLQIHLVVSAARALEEPDESVLKSLPLRPDAAALTHLDATQRWGRVAEWLTALDLPVQFISTGPEVPNGVRAFSSSWFVEEVMDLG